MPKPIDTHFLEEFPLLLLEGTGLDRGDETEEQKEKLMFVGTDWRGTKIGEKAKIAE